MRRRFSRRGDIPAEFESLRVPDPRRIDIDLRNMATRLSVLVSISESETERPRLFLVFCSQPLSAPGSMLTVLRRMVDSFLLLTEDNRLGSSSLSLRDSDAEVSGGPNS